MVAIHTWIKQTHLQSHIVMQVHDELVLQVPDCELKQVLDYIPQAMSNVATLSVPLIANVMVGKNWDEAH
jgi:DNA polymerase-1